MGKFVPCSVGMCKRTSLHSTTKQIPLFPCPCIIKNGRPSPNHLIFFLDDFQVAVILIKHVITGLDFAYEIQTISDLLLCYFRYNCNSDSPYKFDFLFRSRLQDFYHDPAILEVDGRVLSLACLQVTSRPDRTGGRGTVGQINLKQLKTLML